VHLPSLRQDIVLPAALAAVAVLLWGAFLSRSMEWGDDWAGYLLQARALVAGDPLREVALNARVVDGSDVQIGPYAYPWAYPALLALIGPSMGWDWAGLKAWGAISLLLLAAASYGLARTFSAPAASALLAALVTLQGPMVSAALRISSDLVFAAVSTSALALATFALAAGHVPVAWRQRCAALIAAASVLAFTIRPTGAVLLVAYPAALAVWAAARPERRRGAAREALVFGLVAVALLATYSAMLPGDGLFHLRLFSLDPRVWAARLFDHAVNLADFFPVDLLSGPLKLLLLGPVLLLAAAGAVLDRLRALPLTLTIAGHLAILTLFPIDQGTRYYLPILPPLVVLTGLGTAAFRPDRRRAMSGPVRRPTPAMLAAAALVAVAIAWAVGVVREDTAILAAQTTPGSTSTQALARFVESVPATSRIAFRKPRALRYLTGRHAVAIASPERLDTIDVYLFDGEHPSFQVERRALDEDPRFEVVFSEPPYRAYRRRDAIGATQGAASTATRSR
jgi:hypothetical protein